jgi:ABC-2 type transport system permease protein
MYHLNVTFATTARIFRQLSHDHRTLALIFVVPCLLVSLMRWMFNENVTVFNGFAPALLAIFPFVIMFLITSITTLRERETGTMERLMATPIGKLDLVVGYMLAFGLLAAIQSTLVSLLLLYGFNLETAGPQWLLVVVAVSAALLGTALGIFISAFARTELQAVQFMPALVVPQILVCGLFMPLSQLPDLLEQIAYAMPLTYAIDALNRVVKETDLSMEMWLSFGVVVAWIVVSIILAGLTLRRKTD